MKKDKYTTAEILTGIRNGNDNVLHFIYKSYFESVRNMVVSKNGTEDLAYDIFQEALVVIYKKVGNKDFQVTKSSFFTYFYSVCRNTLFKYYEVSSKDVLPRSVDIEGLKDLTHDYEEEERLIMEGIKEQLFHKYILELPEYCFKILQLVIAGMTAKVIAQKLNLSSEGYVRNRKKVCLDTLIKMIKKDPKSKELL